MHDREKHTDDLADVHSKEQNTEEKTAEEDILKTGLSNRIVLGSADNPTENEAHVKASQIASGEKVSINRTAAAQEHDTQFLPRGFKKLLNDSSGNGHPLDEPVRQEMESGTGTNLGNIRIHADEHAAELNRQINSGAFALGNDVYFGNGNYNPQSGAGKHLLAHELVHTQQGNENVVRRANDEELERLRKHNSTPEATDGKAKEKADKQAELDTFINQEGGKQSRSKLRDEFDRQRGLVLAKDNLADAEENLKTIRNRYVNRLREAGVSPDGVSDPFAPIKDVGVDRKKFLKRLTHFFELYDGYLEDYNRFNAEIKTDREHLVDQNEGMKKMYSDFGLSLKGVQPGKTKDPRSPSERAEEILKWAEAEVQTSAIDYTLLVRNKEKEDRDKKKGTKKDDFDPFVSAQTIVRDDLAGDLKKLETGDLQLVLRYFLKGSLTEDDKFTLVAFLQKHINDNNLEKIFGYSDDVKSQIIDPADLIKVLESYDLLNHERRPYYEKISKGSKTFLELDRVKTHLVTRLKDMKAAKDDNDARAKNGSLTSANKNFTGKQEPYKPFGAGGFTSSFMRNVSQETPKTYFPQVMFPDWRHLAATKLQDAITKYQNATPTPPISELQPAAWEYYQSVYPGKLTEAQFYASYNTLSEIKFLVTTTVNPVELSGSNFRSTTDSWTELGEQVLSVALKTGVDYLQLKERLNYFKATNPTGYYLSLSTLGATGLILSLADGSMHSKTSWGQTLPLIGQLGLSGSYPIINPTKTPVYGGSVTNKLSFDWDTKRDDAPPGAGLFNTLYNQGNAHPFFKGKNSVPGLFVNPGISGSHTINNGTTDTEKLTYNFKVTIHYAPGSEGTTASEETVMGRIGMFLQQPFNPDQASSLINSSPTEDMYNVWGKGGFTYKRDWFSMSGSGGGGFYNLSGDKDKQMKGFDYKLNAGAEKKFGDFTIGGGAGISGSYADSPSVKDPSVSANLNLNAKLQWKSFTMNLSFDDDLTKNSDYNKYKAELEYSGLGRYNPWVLKAIFMNMYNQGQDQMVFTSGIGIGYKFGSGGKNFKRLPF